MLLTMISPTIRTTLRASCAAWMIAGVAGPACSSKAADPAVPPRRADASMLPSDAAVPPRDAAIAEPDRRDAAASPVEHRERCGDVTAIWRGERDDGHDLFEELWFEIGHGARPLRMPTGDLSFSDWSFGVFSPDCRHVLLLYSHEGPYHVVRTARLASYLTTGKPDFILEGKPDPRGVTGTGVFHDGAWISNTEVSYQWGCCDPPIVTRFVLPKAT